MSSQLWEPGLANSPQLAHDQTENESKPQPNGLHIASDFVPEPPREEQDEGVERGVERGASLTSIVPSTVSVGGAGGGGGTGPQNVEAGGAEQPMSVQVEEGL